MAIITLPGASKKGNSSSTVSAMNMVDPGALVKYSGTFANGPFGTVSATATVVLKGSNSRGPCKGHRFQRPDLHVYLSKEMLPINFLDLGQLNRLVAHRYTKLPGCVILNITTPWIMPVICSFVWQRIAFLK